MLAHQIGRLRKEAGMSQSQLAKELHISISAVGMYEQGRRTPAIDILIQMAQLFGVSLDYLLTGVEVPNTATGEKGIGTCACPCMTCQICCSKRTVWHVDNHRHNGSKKP